MSVTDSLVLSERTFLSRRRFKLRRHCLTADFLSTGPVTPRNVHFNSQSNYCVFVCFKKIAMVLVRPSSLARKGRSQAARRSGNALPTCRYRKRISFRVERKFRRRRRKCRVGDLQKLVKTRRRYTAVTWPPGNREVRRRSKDDVTEQDGVTPEPLRVEEIRLLCALEELRESCERRYWCARLCRLFP